MAFTQSFDEEQTRALLAGDDTEANLALAAIDRHLRGRLCRWLRWRFPGLSPDDLASAWSDTLLAALRAARASRFDPGRPLLPWLRRIAHARAVDHTRRATARAGLLHGIYRTLRGSGPGSRYAALEPAERREVLALIDEAIDALPERQRIVVQAFVDHYPEATAMDVLREAVSQATGQEETLAAVKRGLQEGRQKIQAFLRRKGYTLGE